MDRRQEIIEAATKSFSMFGYKATTMEQVAKIANVGKGTIYTFFATKEQLLQEVVVSLIQEVRIEMDKTIVPEDVFMDNAHRALMTVLRFREKHVLFAKLIEEEKALRTPAVQQILQVIEFEIVSYIAQRIQTGIDKGEIEPCETQLVAFLLLKSYFAFVVDWQQTHEQPINEQQILAVFEQTIFNGLKKR